MKDTSPDEPWRLKPNRGVLADPGELPPPVFPGYRRQGWARGSFFELSPGSVFLAKSTPGPRRLCLSAPVQTGHARDKVG